MKSGPKAGKDSLPLDGGAWLGGQVVEYAVDSLDLCEDTLDDPVQKRPRGLFNGSGHCILGVDCTDDDGPVP